MEDPRWMNESQPQDIELRQSFERLYRILSHNPVIVRGGTQEECASALENVMRVNGLADITSADDDYLHLFFSAVAAVADGVAIEQAEERSVSGALLQAIYMRGRDDQKAIGGEFEGYTK